MDRSFHIGKDRIGAGSRCYLIAEAGVNHNGDLAMAHRLVDAAVDAGADAVKFQTFRAESLVTVSAPKAAYQKATTDAGESQFAMLKKLELSREAHVALQAHAAQRGITFLSTPFDEESADFLKKIGVSTLKISSGDLTNTPFLEHLAGMGLPVLLSTGMATLEEARAALKAMSGGPPLGLFHCVTSYPAPVEQTNLRAMETLSREFAVPVGFSDHSDGIVLPIAAVAMGAAMVEKHLTLDRHLPGPDHAASLSPEAWGEMARSIRAVEAAMGDGVKRPAPCEEENIPIARKGLTLAVDAEGGTVLTPAHVCVRRPALGMAPSALAGAIGRTLRVGLRRGDPLREEDLL